MILFPLPLLNFQLHIHNSPLTIHYSVLKLFTPKYIGIPSLLTPFSATSQDLLLLHVLPGSLL
jgi:hypothetical protein